MYGIDHYFAKENTGVPYTDAAENLGDYFSLILYLGDLAVAWKNERDGDGDVLPRGICSTDALPEAVLSYTETAPPERRISPFEPVIQEAVRSPFRISMPVRMLWKKSTPVTPKLSFA